MKFIAVVLTTTLLPLTANAQKKLDEAIDNFVNNKRVAENITSNSEVETSTDGLKKRSFFYCYDFSLPQSAKSELQKLRNAFNNATADAYATFFKSANKKISNRPRFVYGDKLNKKLDFGKMPQKNYQSLCIEDKKDTLSRYIYGLIWYDDANTGLLCGSVLKVYSRNPDKIKTSPYAKDLVFYALTLEATNGKYKLKPYATDIKSNEDVLEQFGLLRSVYKKVVKDAKDSTMQTITANRIASLFRNFGSLLSSSEKETCRAGLYELSDLGKDEYLSFMLANIASDLGK